MKTGHNKNIIRFDIEFSEQDREALDEMLERCHRSRKSFGEALVRLAIKQHVKGTRFIDLNDLGVTR